MDDIGHGGACGLVDLAGCFFHTGLHVIADILVVLRRECLCLNGVQECRGTYEEEVAVVEGFAASGAGG